MAWVVELVTYDNGKVVEVDTRRFMFRGGALSYLRSRAGDCLDADAHECLRRYGSVSVSGGQKSVIIARCFRAYPLAHTWLTAVAVAVLTLGLPSLADPQVGGHAGGGGPARTGAVDVPVAVRTVYLVSRLTVWSDGTVEVCDANTLTARAARQLADRLQNLEEAERAVSIVPKDSVIVPKAVLDALTGNRAAPAAGNGIPSTPEASAGAPQADARRCAAIAVSTGQRCRNAPERGATYCNIHARTHSGG
ncbi:MAG: hypothetical protein KIPDCIKN_04340 [Haliscomenobacter sp.]|nr:hypothetical protein [Haliscomenobacter sp.]